MNENTGAVDDHSLYQAAFEQSLDGILVVSGGRVIRANRACCDLIGLPHEEVVGADPATFVHPDEAEDARAVLRRLISGEASECARTFRLRHASEGDRWVETTCRSFVWKEVHVVLGILRDITGSRRLEARLETSEQEHRDLFDSLPIGLYRTLPDGTIVDANPALVRMLKYPSREALLSIMVEDGYVAAEARRAWQDQIEAEGVVQGTETLWRTFDQKALWIEEHARAVKDGRGDTAYYEGSAIDISQRKAAERALQRERAYFEQLFAGAPEAVVLSDNRGTFLRGNAEFFRMFGYEESEAVGRSVDDLVAPSSVPEAAEARDITGHVTTGDRLQMESIRYRKDGTPIHVSVLAQPIFLDDQQVGLYSIYRDISRRVEAEQALIEEKARFEQLYAASPEAIVLCSNDGTIHRVNAEFTRLFGHTEDEAAGQCVDVLLARSDPKQVGEATALTARIAAGETGSLEAVRYHKDGRPIHVSILGKPIRIDEEQVAVYGIYRDISARKEAEAALQEAHAKVEQLHAAALDLEHTETLAAAYRGTIEAAEKILGYSHCAVDIVVDEHLITVATSDATPKVRFRRVPITEADIAGRAIIEGRSSILHDPDVGSLVGSGERPIRSLITAPMGGIGVFQAASDRVEAFSEADGRLLGILMQHTLAAIERIRLESALKEQATHDPLTGVFNRRYFNEVIEKETLRASRYEHPIGLLMIDVNRFKQINDQCGHKVGDDVLQTIATLLQEEVRGSDLVIRYGGDEFLIVLIETGEDADTVAERIRAAISRNARLQSLAGTTVTVSVGTNAWNPDSGQSISHVLAQADERMYEEKRTRRSS